MRKVIPIFFICFIAVVFLISGISFAGTLAVMNNNEYLQGNASDGTTPNNLIAKDDQERTAIVTESGRPIVFKDGSDENIFIDGDGNVGIGTTTPGAILDISKSIGTGSNGVELDFDFNTTGGFPTGLSTMVNLTGNFSCLYGHNASASYDGSESVGTMIGIYGYASARGSGATVPLVYGLRGEVNYRNSNVTTAVGVSSEISRSKGTGSLENAYCYVGDLSYTGATNNWGVYIYGDDKNYFSGKVGIGTETPQSKLDVAGKITATEMDIAGIIKAEEIIVETPGADVVFEDDYKLASLESVENFIKENKHLPEIPSAKKVQENGMPLSDMVTGQLRKIEELTLYLIQMNENLQTKDDTIKKLEARLTALEAK
ncbi:MAG: hypothetical protein K9L30_07215 [Desulfobacterales bacterium]|nr:hypothetical protein [Desulfobacterales bacterium]